MFSRRIDHERRSYGAKVPAGIDGLSIGPELIDESASGRKQATHEYLYWELGGWTAIRHANWRAVRPRKSQSRELYDSSTDPSESRDRIATQPAVLAKLTALARQAHQPVQEGTFAATDRNERDRRAKFGKQDEPEPAKGAPRKNNKKKATK